MITNGKRQTISQFPSRGYLSTISPILHFGVGDITKIDTLTVTWESGKQEQLFEVVTNQVLTLDEKNAKAVKRKTIAINPIFTEVEPPLFYENKGNNFRDFDRQPLLICQLSHRGPCMAKGDLNDDGIADIVFGGDLGQPTTLYLGGKNGGFTKRTAYFEKEANSVDTDIAIFDANNDGHSDILVASGGYHRFQKYDPLLQDRLYLNDGKGNFSKAVKALPSIPTSTGAIAVSDINGDGFQDIFVGGSVMPGEYPKSAKSSILINDGQGKFTNQIHEIAPELATIGIVTDAIWVDVNKDQQEDLVVVGTWLPVSIFINNNGKLENQTNTYLDKNYHGWWNTIATADLNKDGQVDLLIGNQGLNNRFQVSEQAPATLTYADFDRNGSIDPIFSYSVQGKTYPDVTRDELLGQLSGLRSRYTNFASYAEETIEDIFDEKALSNANKLTANRMETTLFLSDASTGKYQLAELPKEVQFSPINAIQFLDYNQDGLVDVVLGGNNSYQKLRMGKADANYGILLEGKGNGEFAYITQSRSGFQLKGDVQSIIRLEDLLIFGVHESNLVSYKF
ncbi:MAG: FG-GAP-like repeat-containing protein [Bacteroidota bacterium]